MVEATCVSRGHEGFARLKHAMSITRAELVVGKTAERRGLGESLLRSRSFLLSQNLLSLRGHRDEIQTRQHLACSLARAAHPKLCRNGEHRPSILHVFVQLALDPRSAVRLLLA